MVKMRKIAVLLIVVIATAVTGENLAQAKVIAGTACQAKGEQTTVSKKVYTCIKSGKKLIWNKGVAVKPSAAPKATISATPTNTPTQASTKPNSAVRTFDLIPTFSMTAYSERLRRYKDRPDGYLYVEQTRGVVQILLPAIPNLDPVNQFFVVIGGGYVSNRRCYSGELGLPLDAGAERNKKSVLYSLLPRSPKGLPIGIVFKVSTFPISFTCYFNNETKYNLSVIETDSLITAVKSQSKPIEFVTPVVWQNLPPPPAPNQVDTFSITPNAICSPEGATVRSTDNKNYVCKVSSIDGVLRWTT
jgi:hypothetical protein